MGTGIGEIALLASLAFTAAGTGMSIYGSQQEADTQARIAGYNRDIAGRNAEANKLASQLQALGEINSARTSAEQARLAGVQSDIDFANAELGEVQALLSSNAAADQSLSDAKTAQLDVRSAIRNSRVLNSYALSIEAQGTERIRRLRTEGRKALALTRNAVAASGVAMSGSPLEVLAENAATMELRAQDAAFETELQAGNVRLQAGEQLFAGRRSMIQARQSVKTARVQLTSGRLARIGAGFAKASALVAGQAAEYAEGAARYRESLAAFAYDAAERGFILNLDTADMNFMAQMGQSRATRNSGWTTLLSGLNTGAGSLVNYYG